MFTLFHRRRHPWPKAEVVSAGLPRARFTRLRMERFPVGIDGLHVDVALGPGLVRAAAIYVSALVRENVQYLLKQPETGTSEAVVDNFRQMVREHHHTVVKEARALRSMERVQLFQLAFLKQLLQRVDDELANVRRELEDARSQRAGQMDGKSLQFHQQAVILGRHAKHVRYRVTNQLVRELMFLEHGGMRNLRQSVLDLSWPVAEEMLANPLLQLGGIGGLRDFVRNYPLPLHELGTAREVGTCLFEALGDWLPDNVSLPPARGVSERAAEAARRHDRGMAHGLLDTERWARCLIGAAEVDDDVLTWIDNPENIVALLGGIDEAWPQPGNWGVHEVERLQRVLNQGFVAALSRAGLLKKAQAGYDLAAIYPGLGLIDAESLIFDYLLGTFNRREMQRRLDTLNPGGDSAALVRRIDTLRKERRAAGKRGNAQLAARLAGDFMTLRRDLKLGLRAFQAMDRIRLLVDERELTLSRTNNVLQMFCQQDLVEDERGSLAGHVVIKVEVRGGTGIAAEMRRRDLNPAAYFSRYFYDPVERLRQQFAAHKVVVEGDALVLTILEYNGKGAERLAVARACCLAASLLELVGAMNRESERQGLPLLELGIGIAYADEAPTYLYDQSRRVVVSPAISRARRLSSCHTLLRESCPLPAGRGLCVAAPVHGERVDQAWGDGLVRYNVNGIELDDAAFVQLNTEVSLRRIRVREKQKRQPTRLYAGRCPDVNGEMHWLLVREQVVKLWVGKQLLETEEEGRSYYEVLTDSRLIDRVLAQLDARTDSRQARDSATVAGVRQ